MRHGGGRLEGTRGRQQSTKDYTQSQSLAHLLFASVLRPSDQLPNSSLLSFKGAVTDVDENGA